MLSAKSNEKSKFQTFLTFLIMKNISKTFYQERKGFSFLAKSLGKRPIEDSHYSKTDLFF